MPSPLKLWMDSQAKVQNPKILFLLNLFGFQLGWWSLVISASYEKEVIGLIIMAILISLHFIFTSQNRSRDLWLMKACSVIGILGDSLLFLTGVLKTTNGSLIIPYWLIGLWFLFPLTLPYSFKEMLNRTRFLPLLALGAAVSYYAGVGLQVLFLGEPLLLSLGLITLFWLFYLVIFRQLLGFISKKN